MSNYAMVAGGGAFALSEGHDIVAGDVVIPFANLDVWGDADRLAHGIRRITDDPIPAGKVATGSTLEVTVGGVRRRWTLEDAPPEPVPDSISDRQFAHGLWKQNVITLDEAKAFVKVGELPAGLAAIVSAMPAETRDDVDLMLSGATVFERSHPAVAMIAAAFGWTDEVTDEFWRYAAEL